MIDDVMKVRLIAASLVAALLAGPVLLDACLFTCHASASIQADADSDAPSCHHAADERDARLEPPPASCGHDHTPAPSIASPVQSSSSDASLPALVDDAASAACHIVWALASSQSGSPPGIHRKPAVPLRV
jgi:hypothetical protein